MEVKARRVFLMTERCSWDARKIQHVKHPVAFRNRSLVILLGITCLAGATGYAARRAKRPPVCRPLVRHDVPDFQTLDDHLAGLDPATVAARENRRTAKPPAAAVAPGPSRAVRAKPAKKSRPSEKDAVAEAAVDVVQFQKFFSTYCVRCHGPKTHHADLRLDELTGLDRKNVHRWQDVLDMLNMGAMPPADEKQPPEKVMKSVVEGLTQTLKTLHAKEKSTGAQVVLRRLNSTEYRNTLRDLLGVELDVPDLDVRLNHDDSESGFDNVGNALVTSPQLLKAYLEIANEVLGDVVRPRDALEKAAASSELLEAHRRLFGDGAVEKSEETAADVLRRFARRAFRRPVDDAVVQRYVSLYAARIDKGENFHAALRAALTGVLCSPRFLYLNEPGGEKEKRAKLDDYALASRLSYFLWSTMPDDELFRLADEGRLQDPAVRVAQLKRMLADERSGRFVTNFSGQWLSVRDVGRTAPDDKLFPDYSRGNLEEAMRQETYRFFRAILDDNLPIETFLDSDFTILNARLAEHYGIEGVDGDEFRRVPLPADSHRGGVLGHAGLLAATSNGTITNPVWRGVWVLDHLLGTPPNPPPPDVEPLEPDVRGSKTVQERLAKHRHVKTCASCHSKIDPLGFALENYDPVGSWRDAYLSDLKIDPTGEMLDGAKLAGPEDLKKYLLSRRDLFARNLTTRLLTYATGRSMEAADRPAVDGVVNELEAKGDGLFDLLTLIVNSEPFLTP